MPETPRIGQECKLYRNTGTNATPTWSEVTGVRDLSLPLAADKVDISDRGSRFKKETGGMIESAISFQLTYRNGNADHAALRAAMLNKTAIEFAVMSGDITTSGEEGLRSFCEVFTFNHEQPLSDGVTVDVEIAPTYAEESDVVIHPSWYTVA